MVTSNQENSLSNWKETRINLETGRNKVREYLFNLNELKILGSKEVYPRVHSRRTSWYF